MPAFLSRMITRLEKAGTSVADSGKAHAGKVAEVLSQRLTPILPEGQPPPDFVGVQLGLVQLVEHGREALLTFDETHVDELADDRAKRSERDASYEELSETLDGIGSAWAGVYGEASRLRLFGEVTQLPQDPVELRRVGARVHRRLTGEEFAAPEVKLEGQSLDHEQLATSLEGRVERLARALADVSLERKGSDETLSVKSSAMNDYNRTVRHAGTCLASLYSLAGFDDLAAKVVPKRRAPRRPNAPGDGDGGEASSPGEDGPSTAPEPATSAPSEPAGEGSPPATESSDAETSDPGSGPLGIVR